MPELPDVEGFRKVFESWRQNTHWGQLFDYYQSHGTLAAADAKASASGS